eukprot:9350654-Pyramimonas_sp.AAC.1
MIPRPATSRIHADTTLSTPAQRPTYPRTQQRRTLSHNAATDNQHAQQIETQPTNKSQRTVQTDSDMTAALTASQGAGF